MKKHGSKGRIKFFGEPAEKMCGSKPVHAAKGYYDDLDAAISFHPHSFPALANSCFWDTHSAPYWSRESGALLLEGHGQAEIASSFGTPLY